LEETALIQKIMVKMTTVVEKMMVLLLLLLLLRYCRLEHLQKPNYKYPSGLVILPSIADAAAVAGEERYTFDERAPILPTKFLEDDDIHISSSPSAPR
jgi:hypothetical protein